MDQKEMGKWVTVNGRHVYINNKTSDGFGGEHDTTPAEKERLKANGISNTIKLTPAEKIASVNIDFEKDNILPELNEETLEEIGLDENKQILFKKSAIDRNMLKHFDLSKADVNNILGEALYNSVETFAANKIKPYFHLAAFVESEISKKLKIGVVLLDVEKTKHYFEIVHVHFVRGETYESLKKKKK